MKIPENRSEEEIRTLRRLKAIHRVTESCCTLFEEFAGMLRDEEQRRSDEQARRQLQATAGVDRTGQSVRDRRAEGLRRKATSGYRGGGGRDDSTLQSGTDRRQDQQAQAREAFDVWSRQLRSVKAACTVRISSVSAHAATRREFELRSSDSRENRTEIRDLFGRHKGAERINHALGELLKLGRVERIVEQTGGRPTERWRAK